jgi:glycosyltransferase involved in cell wall biosynthesis
MKIAMALPGGVDRSGRDRVVPMLLWLIERLATRHDLHVFVIDYYDEPCTYQLLGATIHDLGRVTAPPGLRRLSMGRRLARALRRHGPFDLLHAYWGVPAVIATGVAPRVRLPLVVTFDSGELVRLDDIEYGMQRRWIDRRAIRSAIRRAAAVTVPTHYMAALMPDRFPPPRIVPVGVDCRIFEPRGAPDGPPWRLVRVGSINRVKDYPTLLHAFASVARREPRVTLDIAGEDRLDGTMQKLSDDLGTSERVRFHGVLRTDRIARLYAGAHVNLVSSRHESANVSVLEAACSVVPTVGTDVGYVADWKPERAVAVPVRQPEALAAAILDLIADRERRRRIAAAACDWARRHDADWTADAFDGLYHEVTRAGRLAR